MKNKEIKISENTFLKIILIIVFISMSLIGVLLSFCWWIMTYWGVIDFFDKNEYPNEIWYWPIFWEYGLLLGIGILSLWIFLISIWIIFSNKK